MREHFLTSELAPLAGEVGVLDLCEDGVVDARLAGDAVPEPVQRIVAWGDERVAALSVMVVQFVTLGDGQTST